MSRTYRLRHLPQPEGGALSRRFVDASVREPARRAEDAFLASHKNLSPQGLWLRRLADPYWALGWCRVVPMYWHPIIGYSLPHVPSSEKKWGRKQAYRRHRRHAKRLLRVLEWTQYVDASYDVSDPWDDEAAYYLFGWISTPKSGPEVDPESDEADFDAKSIKSGLKRSAWLLTW